MITYEVYDAPPCSCDSEWELLGTVQVTSYADLEWQLRRNWPDVTSILAIDTKVGSITTINTVTRSVAHPVAS